MHDQTSKSTLIATEPPVHTFEQNGLTVLEVRGLNVDLRIDLDHHMALLVPHVQHPDSGERNLAISPPDLGEFSRVAADRATDDNRQLPLSACGEIDAQQLLPVHLAERPLKPARSRDMLHIQALGQDDPHPMDPPVPDVQIDFRFQAALVGSDLENRLDNR